MANFTKFFRNGKTFSAFCRMRYGQSKQIWDDTSLWERSGKFVIAFDIDAADAKFAAAAPVDGENDFADEEAAEADYSGEKRMEEMAAYIHSGAGLDNYYKDRDAGYAY